MSLPKVLVVDDERDNLEALRRLVRKDFEVITATSGEEGLEIFKLRHAELDVVVSDQRMPGMQGSEFLERVAEVDPLATRLLLTGFSDLEAVVDAVNRGQIWRYMSKPWEPDDLKQTISQAAERTRLQRSLQASRLELERAANELRAKDWSRERLLQILLHEFRTGPQILSSLRELDGGGEDSAARLRFITNLEKRFEAMSQDITDLLADEKRVATLPKQIEDLVPLTRELEQSFGVNVSLPQELNSPKVLLHRPTLESALKHFYTLMKLNTAHAPVKLALDWDNGARADIFFTLTIESSRPLLPEGLAQSQSDPKLAWPALLEPFVGIEDFTRHSTGLRVETARFVRVLAALGGKCAFQVSRDDHRVELLIVFKSIES